MGEAATSGHDEPAPSFEKYIDSELTMKYYDGSEIALGDVVTVPIPSGTARARVVMLGDTYEHLKIDPQFLAWVKTDNVLQRSSIVIEWIGSNPFAHNDKRYAPVGNYMFTTVDEWVKREPIPHGQPCQSHD